MPVRAVIQRVRQASVEAEGRVVGAIQAGLLVLLGIEDADTPEDVEWLCGKISRMRIFDDAAGLMNKDVIETKGDVIVVSQFTLFAATKKGNRPSFIRAARPAHAQPLYEAFVKAMQATLGRQVGTGIFGAHMAVSLLNDGPVTIIIDSHNRE